jgi:rhodanese-related sulfurtransferase
VSAATNTSAGSAVKRVERDAATIEELLRRARARIERLPPARARAEMLGGAVLVDIRSDTQRASDGEIPDAVPIARNVLEWRCDPSSRWRDQRTSDTSVRLILLCDEGCQSSLAAATLQTLGHARVADVIGGFRAWRDARLPVRPPFPAVRRG